MPTGTGGPRIVRAGKERGNRHGECGGVVPVGGLLLRVKKLDVLTVCASRMARNSMYCMGIALDVSIRGLHRAVAKTFFWLVYFHRH